MWMVQVHQCKTSSQALFVLRNSSSFSNGKSSSFSIHPRISTTTHTTKRTDGAALRIKATSQQVNFVTNTEQFFSSVKAIVSVKVVAGGMLSNISFTRGLDDITDLLGKSLILELVSSETSGEEGKRVKAYAHKISQEVDEAKYECDFTVPTSFGEVGAVLIENEHHKEMYLNNVVIDGFSNGPVNITCHSWVTPNDVRVFFTNKVAILSLFL